MDEPSLSELELPASNGLSVGVGCSLSAFSGFILSMVATAQPLPVRLRQSASRVDQRGPRRTSLARARITLRSACAVALDVLLDPALGSIRANRARVRASIRSSFFGSLRSVAHCGHAPRSLRVPVRSERLTHGEWIPVSSAMRLRGVRRSTLVIAVGVVPSFCSRTTSPTSSSTQYQRERSPDRNRSSASARENFSSASTGSANLLHCRSPFSLVPRARR